MGGQDGYEGRGGRPICALRSKELLKLKFGFLTTILFIKFKNVIKEIVLLNSRLTIFTLGGQCFSG